MRCSLTKYDSIAAAPSFPALRRFPQGRRFKQWTGDDSKALMKVSMRVIKSIINPHEYDVYRCTCPLSQGMFTPKWFSVSPLSWTLAIWHAVLTSTKTPSPNCKQRLDAFTNIGKSSVPTPCDQLGSHFRDNTHYLIIPIKYTNSVPRQVCVPPSLSRDTLRPSSDHGDGRTGIMLWGRCSLQTSAWTSSRLHATTSCIEVYSPLPMLPCQNPC